MHARLCMCAPGVCITFAAHSYATLMLRGRPAQATRQESVNVVERMCGHVCACVSVAYVCIYVCMHV
jgi:hypothetical protein